MNVYWTDDFAGYNPVGSAAVVVANDVCHARRVLKKELAKKRLSIRDDAVMHELDITAVGAVVIRDGDY